MHVTVIWHQTTLPVKQNVIHDQKKCAYYIDLLLTVFHSWHEQTPKYNVFTSEWKTIVKTIKKHQLNINLSLLPLH